MPLGGNPLELSIAPITEQHQPGPTPGEKRHGIDSRRRFKLHCDA